MPQAAWPTAIDTKCVCVSIILVAIGLATPTEPHTHTHINCSPCACVCRACCYEECSTHKHTHTQPTVFGERFSCAPCAAAHTDKHLPHDITGRAKIVSHSSELRAAANRKGDSGLLRRCTVVADVNMAGLLLGKVLGQILGRVQKQQLLFTIQTLCDRGSRAPKTTKTRASCWTTTRPHDPQARHTLAFRLRVNSIEY